jgi:nifR3 family TIM-barrel protein
LIAEKLAPLKIGSLVLANPLILAPLSGISNLPFRLLAKEQGCALVFTEMVSAEGLVRNRKAMGWLLKSSPEERPLGVQLFGSTPGSMAAAAKIVEETGAAIVDLNMGCPVRKVVNGGSGAALLKDPRKAGEIMDAVRKALSIPLSVKIRTGWDEKNLNYLEIGRIAENCGVDALTLHGRTRRQGYSCKADWQAIAEAKSRLRIPVIGNGDLTSPEAIGHFFALTGADGGMIGRGALGNPWIFRQTLRFFQGALPEPPTLEEKEKTILRHFRMIVDSRGEENGVREFRKHLLWYTRGLRGSSEFRSQAAQWVKYSEVIRRVEEYFEKIRKVSFSS